MMKHTTKLGRISLVSAALTMAAAFATTGAAHAAAPGAAQAAPAAPAAPSSTDVTAARDAANGALPTVAQFFASGGQKPQGDARQLAAAATAAAPHIDSATVPVYYLAPAFVADASASGTAAPVSQLTFMATDAVSTAGAHASVWTAQVDGGWKVVNIASGSDETTYTGSAKPGASVFKEPQIGAWYQVLDGRVLPLNDNARASVGAKGMTLAQYHQLVRGRYADKMPGSAYDKGGRAGGFQPQGPADTSSSNAAPLTGGLVLIGFGVAGAGAVAWRRSREQRG